MRNPRLMALIMAIAALLSMAHGVLAETGFDSAFAAVRAGKLYFNLGGDVYLGVENPPNRGILSTAWSFDGSRLAYILYDEEYQLHLWVVDAEQGVPVRLEAGRLEAGFPVSFTPDGDILYVESTYDPANPTVTYTVNVNRIAPAAGSAPVTIGSVTYGVGCGGGSPMPTDWQYWQESGFGGSYLTLRWTDYGILHSVICSGSGLALLNPRTGEDRFLTPITLDANGMPMPGENISRFALAPDGRTLAAVKTVYAEPDPVDSLVLLDIESGALTDQPTTGEPEQLAWANDGTLYYTTREPRETLTDGLTPEQTQMLETATGGSGLVVGTYAVHIRQFNPATGEDRLVYTADAYQVARMQFAADGSLWFSVIPNLNRWFDDILAGTLKPVDDFDGSQQRAAVPVTVYRMDLSSGQNPEMVGADLNLFALRPAGA